MYTLVRPLMSDRYVRLAEHSHDLPQLPSFLLVSSTRA